MFIPSPEQAHIFDAISDPLAGNLCVDAKAGSGKTTTILEGMKHVPTSEASLLKPSVVFLAFSKDIADTLAARVPQGVAAKTFHSLGRTALVNSGQVSPSRVRARDWLDGRKCAKLVWNAMGNTDPDVQHIIRLVSLLKSTHPICDPKDLIVHHDLDIGDVPRACRIALRVLADSDRNLDTIDFDDMLHLPITLDMKFPTYDYVFVDECQDLNGIQHEIVDRLLGPKSRLIAVGDPHQAIYGFRGANADSMAVLAERFSCATFPLSVSYRCPRSVVREAQKYIK